MSSPFRKYWDLDPEATFLNHGSFGACPRSVLEYQSRLRARLEAQPVQFFVRDAEGLQDAVRRELGQFIGSKPENLAFVRNATSAVNSIIRSLELDAGDELIVTNHAYNACKNAFEYVAERSGARVVLAEIPFPISDPREAVEAIEKVVTPRTRLALIDYVTSPTGLILPVEKIVPSLEDRGIRVLLDGAHAPGMLPLDLDALGASYFTGNCHKWLCAPKGAGILHVRPDRQKEVRPNVISHGANSKREGRPRYWLEFDWTGTDDPTAVFSIGESLRCLSSMVPGGMPEVRERNRNLVLEGRRMLCDRLQIDPPAPESMIGSLAAVPLPDSQGDGPDLVSGMDPLGNWLWFEHGIEVPVSNWPSFPHRVLRISAQLYNERAEYEKLVDVLLDGLSKA